MSQTVQLIPFGNLALAFIPALIVVFIFYRWSLDFRDAFYAMSRMLAQLLLVGYFLNLIFESDQALIVLFVLLIMVSTLPCRIRLMRVSFHPFLTCLCLPIWNLAMGDLFLFLNQRRRMQFGVWDKKRAENTFKNGDLSVRFSVLFVSACEFYSQVLGENGI